MRPRASLSAVNGNGLDVLCTQNRAAAAAAGMPPVVRDRRVANLPLAGRTNGGDAVFGSEPSTQSLFRHVARGAAEVAGALDSHAAVVDNQHGQLRRSPDDDERIGA